MKGEDERSIRVSTKRRIFKDRKLNALCEQTIGYVGWKSTMSFELMSTVCTSCTSAYTTMLCVLFSFMPKIQIQGHKKVFSSFI